MKKQIQPKTQKYNNFSKIKLLKKLKKMKKKNQFKELRRKNQMLLLEEKELQYQIMLHLSFLKMSPNLKISWFTLPYLNFNHLNLTKFLHPKIF